MIKEIKFNTEAREAVLKGINIVADAVKSTYGPNGRNVMIEVENDIPHITKDGVTVAASIQLEDAYASIGAKLIQGVASKTLKDVGDGTTTSTILTQAIINEGLKELQYGMNAFKLKQGIDFAVKEITKQLKEASKIIDKDSLDVKTVAFISTNGDTVISDLLYNVYKEIGKDSVITVKDSVNLNTYHEIIEGIQLPNGYENPLFAKGENKIIYDNALVFISKENINNMNMIVPALKEAQTEQLPILIISPEIDKGILDTLLVNNYHNKLNVTYVRMPGSTEIQREQLDDLAVVTGKEFKLNTTTLGKVKQIIIEQYSTSIIPLIENIDNINHLKDVLKNDMLHSDTSFKALKYKERISKLSGKVATIYIGANSEIELKEKKDRVDDAIHAVKAALDEGVIEGAGKVLKEIADSVCAKFIFDSKYELDIMNGITLINKICNIPFETLNKTKANNVVLDPVKVVYTTLNNAASVAGLFLTTNCVIVNKL